MELTFPTGEEVLVCIFLHPDGNQVFAAVTTAAGRDGPSMLLWKAQNEEPVVLVFDNRGSCDEAFIARTDGLLAQGYECRGQVVMPLRPMPDDEPPEPMTWDDRITARFPTSRRPAVHRWAGLIFEDAITVAWGGLS